MIGDLYMESNILAKRLKQLREEHHISQAKIGKMCGITQNAVFKYENGVSFPPMNILLFYADYFNISLDWLFGRCDNREGKAYSGISKSDQDRVDAYTEEILDESTPLGKKLMKIIHTAIKEEMNEKNNSK